MMGEQARTESLFYYFRLEEQIPETHLLRMLDRYIDFSFVRERLKGFYSLTGRPSIDPEVLLRLLLVGYLYGITSERRLLDEVRMHLAYRWFTRLDFNAEIPDHSTFSKNRHGRFRQSGVFREVFEEIVRRCVEAGLVEGETLAVDGTMVAADASQHSRIGERSCGRPRRYRGRCNSIWPSWSKRIRSRIRRWFPLPILMHLWQPRVADRRGWLITITISSTPPVG
jgi:transposase